MKIVDSSYFLIKICFLTMILVLVESCSVGETPIDFDKEEQCINSIAERFETITFDDGSREYILHLPTTYNDDTPTPLVINFHGFGDCASSFSEFVGSGLSNLNSFANENNFIVAYPQGVTRQKGSPEWDPGDNGIQNIVDNDIYFVEELISFLNVNYNIDRSRVYATGYSNGGMMAYGLACKRPDLIAAIGIMSGVMLPDDCVTGESTAVIHFHGFHDEVLPYVGNQDYQSIDEIVNFWLNQNNIPNVSISQVLNAGDVFYDVYTDGDANTSFELYTVRNEYGNQGGHVWFTAEIKDKHPNQILWDFLSTYTTED